MQMLAWSGPSVGQQGSLHVLHLCSIRYICNSVSQLLVYMYDMLFCDVYSLFMYCNVCDFCYIFEFCLNVIVVDAGLHATKTKETYVKKVMRTDCVGIYPD